MPSKTTMSLLDINFDYLALSNLRMPSISSNIYFIGFMQRSYKNSLSLRMQFCHALFEQQFFPLSIECLKYIAFYFLDYTIFKKQNT